MIFYFDYYGWVTDEAIKGRETTITPPADDGNLKANWTGFGWTLLPYIPPTVKIKVPESITPRQIRQALSRAGLRGYVESAVAASDQDTKDWYEWATKFERNHPLVIGMGESLGQSTEQMDNLFILGESL